MTLSEKYAKALYESVKGKTGDVLSSYFSNFIAVLKKNGYKNFLPKILIDYCKILERESSDSGIKVVLSKKGLNNNEKDMIAKIKKDFDLFGSVKTEINDNIIGGFIIQTKNIRIDKSYKKYLDSLYKKIIS